MQCAHENIVTCTRTHEVICIECGAVLQQSATADEFAANERAGSVGSVVPLNLQFAQHIADADRNRARQQMLREERLVTQLLTALDVPLQHLGRILNLIETMFIITAHRWRGRKRSLLRGACVAIATQKQGLYIDVDDVCAKIRVARRTALYKQIREIRTLLADLGTEADMTLVNFEHEISTHIHRFARMLALPYSRNAASQDQIARILHNQQLNSKAARSLAALCVFSANSHITEFEFSQATGMSLDTTRRLRCLRIE